MQSIVHARRQPGQFDALFERCNGLGRTLGVYPDCIPQIDVETLGRNRRNAPSTTCRLGLEAHVLRALGRVEVKYAFAILRHERIEVYQRTNTLRNPVSDATDYGPAVRVAAENYIR